jgi:xanthine/uracil permease
MTAGDPIRTDPTEVAGTRPADDVRPVEAPADRRGRRISSEAVADLVITLLLLALSAWAFLEANQWSDRAGLFPHLVSGAMFVLSGLNLFQVFLRMRREAAAGPAPAPGSPDEHDASGHLPPGRVAEPHGAEDDVNEDDVEYVFQTAGARRWASALAWIAGFFVLLYVAGLYITAPVFSMLYLRFAGRRTWRLSVVYAVVAGAVLYLAFEVALAIPTPQGLFLD